MPCVAWAFDRSMGRQAPDAVARAAQRSRSKQQFENGAQPGRYHRIRDFMGSAEWKVRDKEFDERGSNGLKIPPH